ncbi:IBR domain-containing protein [Tanacetum coccineum]
MITAERPREFMAAAAIDSDLDFAYRLQLEEAINASKTLTNPHNDVIMTDTQPEPMIINDQVYIPHGEGCSSNHEEGEKVFKVYFKGIVSEERVGNLAGIGVVICDMKGEVVFEKRKEVVSGEKVSKGSAEGMALLEALNSAVAFGAKRLVLCFDYHTLFQYVSGRWQPKQQKIQTFVDEANLLRKKFTHCESSLIAKKDVKLAYKLAREALSPQITKAMESSKKIENCVICLEDKSVDQFFSVKGCNHEYCCDCMKQHVEANLLDGMMPKCPHEVYKMQTYDRVSNWLLPYDLQHEPKLAVIQLCQAMPTVQQADNCYASEMKGCGYEFCYTCGAEWKNKKATCGCPLWDEENIVDSEESDDDSEVEEVDDFLDMWDPYDGYYY